jgi:hypothetical protein
MLVYDSEHSDMRSQVVRECNGLLYDTVSIRLHSYQLKNTSTVVCMPALVQLEYNDRLTQKIDTKNANVFISYRGYKFALFYYKNKW